MEIISAKYLISMEMEPLFDGAIAVENGEIIDIATEEDLLERYPEALHEDYPNHVLMPGLINAHTHLDMTRHKDFPLDPVRLSGIDVNFVDWLLACIAYKRDQTQEQLRVAVEEGLNLCIEAGTTSVGDMGSYEGFFQSLEQANIRGVLFPEVLSYNSYVARDLFETAMAIVEKYSDDDSQLISVGMGPYSPYTLSRNILKIMSQYSISSNLPLMMHTAESFSEMEFFYDSTGDIASKLFPNIGWGDTIPPAFRKTPIEYLSEIGFLAARPILVGCVQASPKDLERIAESKSKVVWCPRSNEYLKLGKTPVGLMHQMGILVALGTDGISSTNTLSLWDELRSALEFIKQNAPNLSARDLINMVTRNAAMVLGLEGEVGTLAIGKRADYIIVDISSHKEGTDIYSQLIENTRNYHVHKVVVDGQAVKTVN